MGSVFFWLTGLVYSIFVKLGSSTTPSICYVTQQASAPQKVFIPLCFGINFFL